MDQPPRASWIRPAVRFGIGYALVGIGFALPATHAQAWRLAAWAVSAAGFAAHIALERVRLPHAPGLAAWHIAVAVAVGAFGLAVGANIHALSADTASQHRQLLLLSLGLWPLITAIPAFLVALVINMILARVFGRARGQ